MNSMRRWTSSGNPQGRVPDLPLAPARERGFAVFVFAFVFDDGLGSPAPVSSQGKEVAAEERNPQRSASWMNA
jgi:hypothetical protein